MREEKETTGLFRDDVYAGMKKVMDDHSSDLYEHIDTLTFDGGCETACVYRHHEDKSIHVVHLPGHDSTKDDGMMDYNLQKILSNNYKKLGLKGIDIKNIHYHIVIAEKNHLHKHFVFANVVINKGKVERFQIYDSIAKNFFRNYDLTNASNFIGEGLSLDTLPEPEEDNLGVQKISEKNCGYYCIKFFQHTILKIEINKDTIGNYPEADNDVGRYVILQKESDNNTTITKEVNIDGMDDCFLDISYDNPSYSKEEKKVDQDARDAASELYRDPFNPAHQKTFAEKAKAALANPNVRKGIGIALIIFGVLVAIAATMMTIMSAGVLAPPASLAGMAAKSMLATGITFFAVSAAAGAAGGATIANSKNGNPNVIPKV